MGSEKKYYWLKLKRDFFKRHDIRIIEEMENGKDYLLFYLKLLVESVDHEGALRFSDTIPYNERMLSVVTNTNVDIVRAALKVFSELNMLEILEDSTIYMSEVERMIGCETEWAKKKREYREKQKEISTADRTIEGQKKTMSDKSKSIEIELEKEIEIDKEKKEKPIHHKYGEYNHVLLTDEQYKKLCDDYGEENTKLAIKKVDEYCQQYGKSYKDYNLTLRKWGYDGIKTKKTSGNSDLDEWAARKEREQNERK